MRDGILIASQKINVKCWKNHIEVPNQPHFDSNFYKIFKDIFVFCVFTQEVVKIINYFLFNCKNMNGQIFVI